MTNEKKNEPTKVTRVTRTEPTYSLEDVLKEARSIGEKEEVLAGALMPLGKEEFTRSEIKKALKDFKNKEVI